jgi:hypothetical protein
MLGVNHGLEARARLGPYELQAPLEAGEKGRGLSRHGHAPNRTGSDQGAAQHLSRNLDWREEKR